MSAGRSGAAGCASVLLPTLLLLVPASARAQDHGAPIEDNDYQLDLAQTTVLGSGRIVGLGGAYTAIAEGIDGVAWNPAAYGTRTLWELDWWEWELTAGILFSGGILEDNDFFNSGNDGDLGFDGFVQLTLGFRLQLEHVGFGVLAERRSFDVGAHVVGLDVIHYGIAFQLLDAQVVLGIGARTASLDVTLEGAVSPEVDLTSTGPEVGILLKPAPWPWRLGAAFRGAVTQERVVDVPSMAAGRYLPREVRLPWEVQVGAAVQIGERPLNARWDDPRIEELAIRGELLARWREREAAQLAREAGGPIAPSGDPYRWMAGRPSSPAFWEREAARREREEEALEARYDEAEERRDRAVKSLPRLYLLITADLIVTGPVADAVGIEGFLQQRWHRSGEETTVGLRLGLEGEPWAGRLKLRAGSYLEPSRFGAGYRVHGTGGFDLRLFTWDVFGLFDDFDFRVSASIDVADRYLDWGVGAGLWH